MSFKDILFDDDYSDPPEDHNEIIEKLEEYIKNDAESSYPSEYPLVESSEEVVSGPDQTSVYEPPYLKRDEDEFSQFRIMQLDSSGPSSLSISEEITFEHPPKKTAICDSELTEDTKFKNVSIKESIYEENKEESMGDQMMKEIYGLDFELNSDKAKIEDTGTKRGRPQKNKPTTMKDLSEVFKQWEKGLLKVLKNKKQRSDSKTISIARHIKKLPDVFLKYI